MSFKKQKVDFRTEGKGIYVVPEVVVKSQEYINLSLAAKAAMTAMQQEWYPWNKGFTSIGVKQVAEKSGVSRKTAGLAMEDLMESGFIVLKKDYGKNKTREWELTWLSYHGKTASFLWRENKNRG